MKTWNLLFACCVCVAIVTANGYAGLNPYQSNPTEGLYFGVGLLVLLLLLGGNGFGSKNGNSGGLTVIVAGSGSGSGGGSNGGGNTPPI